MRLRNTLLPTPFSSPRLALAVSALLIFLGAWGGGPASAAAAAPDEDESRAFLEAWVFGGGREAAIDRLVPGTERYFLFRCLLHQSERRLDLADAVLEEAAAARVSSPRLEQMRNRQAVLRGGADPKRMIERLKRKLGLRLDHRRPNAASDASLPTSLPSETLDRNRLFREALRRDPARIVEFSDAALPSLAVRDDLSDAQVRSLLERLDHPAVPGLAELVIRDLRRRSTSDFGSIGIHRRLLRSQLLRCLDARPDLQDDPEFVATYLARLAPRPNEDPELDPTDREACLARLESFVYRLSPVFLPLRAHVLYHRLRHERSQGRFDRERFLEYVRLPRVVSYGNPEGLRGKRAFRLGTVTDTGFAPVKDDEALVHELFLELFRDEESYEPYQRHVREEVLRKWFVESKLLYGKGDVSRYASILDDPAEFAAIRDRVEMRFAETMLPVFRANDPVVLIEDVARIVGFDTIAIARRARGRAAAQ